MWICVNVHLRRALFPLTIFFIQCMIRMKHLIHIIRITAILRYAATANTFARLNVNAPTLVLSVVQIHLRSSNIHQHFVRQLEKLFRVDCYNYIARAKSHSVITRSTRAHAQAHTNTQTYTHLLNGEHSLDSHQMNCSYIFIEFRSR